VLAVGGAEVQADLDRQAAVALRRLDRGPFPNPFNYNYSNAQSPVPALARTDYAANCGHLNKNELFSGPATLQQGDDPKYKWPDASIFTGIVFQRSEIRFADVKNGTSNT
jgi:hypothetical protein